MIRNLAIGKKPKNMTSKTASPQLSDYTHIYSSQELANILNKLESAYCVGNEENRFEKLVNMSTSLDKAFHRWAKYREGYSGELVKELIRRSNLNPEKHFIYDPMSGSGSTLVSSIEEGFDALGSDVNPYAIDVTKVKIKNFPDDLLQDVERFISEQLQDEVARPWKRLVDLSAYFKPENLRLAQKIIDNINCIQNEDVKHLLFTAWLMSLEDISERKKDGNGLATRPSPINDVWTRFVLQVKMMLNDLRKHHLPINPARAVLLESAFFAPRIIRDFSESTRKTLGAIIFSPPYANSFDYFESYKLELLSGYYTSNELIKAREKTIRNYRKGYGYQLTSSIQMVDLLCNEVRERIPIKEKEAGKTDNRSRLVPNLLVGYFEDMANTIKGFADASPEGAYCHIVVDQSSYLGVIIPTDLILANIAELYGYQVKEIIRCRSARTSPQQLKLYPYLKNMLRESIVSLRKK